MTRSAKQKTLLLLGLVMIMIIIIAASLPQLELQPGMPLPMLAERQLVATQDKEQSLMAISISEFILVLFGLLMAGSILYATYRLLKGANWRILKTLIPVIIAISVIFTILLFLIMMFPRSSSTTPMDVPLPTPTPPARTPLGPVPPLLAWLVGIGLLVITILIGVWIYLTSTQKPTTINLLGLEAEKAWQALKTGMDLKDVIIQCYRQMSLALKQDQAIERKAFMTVREFENQLDTVGVPHAPVHQLSMLFEAVRYGNWQPNPADEQKAIQCLEAIMLYCRGKKDELM